MNISLHHVAKTFTDAEVPLAALAPTTLEVSSGEFICLIGPSGCGKSTLLRLIADQIQPTQGEIYLDDITPAMARARKAIAWMAQNPALLPWQTVLENIQLPLRINRQHQRPAPAPLTLLRMVDLEAFAEARPTTLSGGMQQRVALARALATGAPIWLMDEPFAALDELTRETLSEDVLRLWAEFQPTVLWVTHNITEAARLADRVIVMTQRPGYIRDIVPVHVPRPRDPTAPEVILLIRRLRQLLGGKNNYAV